MTESSANRIKAEAEFIVADQLPLWEVKGFIDRGAFAGTVLLKSKSGSRTAALKILHPNYNRLGDGFDSENILDRFRREIKNFSKLEHPNIPGFIEGDAEFNPPWYLMRYMAGKSLKDNIEAQGPLKEDKWFLMADELLSALEHAHSHDLIHRDLNPGNVLMTGHGAMLIDFGLATQVDTRAGLAFGTFMAGPREFCSPEQLWGQPLSSKSDVFSLATLLAYAGKGRPVWMNDEERIKNGEADYTGLSGEQQAFLMHMHVKEPALRPSAAEARENLRDLFRLPRIRGGSQQPASNLPEPKKPALQPKAPIKKPVPKKAIPVKTTPLQVDADWASLRDAIYLFLSKGNLQDNFLLEFDSSQIAGIFVQGFWEGDEGALIEAATLGLVPPISADQHLAFLNNNWNAPDPDNPNYSLYPDEVSSHPVLVAGYIVTALRECYGLKRPPKISTKKKFPATHR